MRVGGLAVADAHQRAASGLDLLRQRHEVAVAAHNDHRPDVIKAAQVFQRVQAEPDIGAILGRGAGRKELDQLDRALQQGVPVAPEELPVAVGAVDGQRAQRRRQCHDGRHVNQGLLRLEAAIGLVVGPFAQACF